MLYIPKIDDYLKTLTYEEVKNFVEINFCEYLNFIKKEQSLRKVARSLCIFLTIPDEVENICNQILLIIVYITIMLRF